MFIGGGVEEVNDGVCQECLKKASDRDQGQRRTAARQLYGRVRERRRSMDTTTSSENPKLDKVVSGRIAHTTNDRNGTSANSLMKTPNYSNRSSETPTIDTERGCLLHYADERQATHMGVGTTSESNIDADASYPFGSSFWETPVPFPSTEAASGVTNPQVEVASFAQEGNSSGNGPQRWGGNPQSGIQLLQPPSNAPGGTLGFSDAGWQNDQLASDPPNVNWNTLDEGSFDFYGDWNFQHSESNPPK